MTASAPPAAAYDAVVAGAGPAGAATALALRRRGLGRVLLAEAGDFAAVRIGESLPPATRLLLERLGIWQDFLAEGHEPCLGSCSLWGGDTPGYNDFLLDPHGHGWHLDRRRFDAWLARQAAAAGAELWEHAHCDGAEPLPGGGFTVRLATGDGPRTVTAGFLVDATGSRARLARSLGARRRFHDRLCYVADFLALPAGAAMSRLTLLEAVEHGWWYAARLPGRRVAVAFASDAGTVQREGLHRREVWRARLGETRLLAPELAEAVPAAGDGDGNGDRLAVRPALSCRLDRPCGRGWLAVGDAASCCDPISSQGIYKALLDGLEAADAVAAGQALDGYATAVAHRFEEYLEVRDHFYGVERRWPETPFWRRRVGCRESGTAEARPQAGPPDRAAY